MKKYLLLALALFVPLIALFSFQDYPHSGSEKPAKTVHVYLVGTGGVGKALLGQIEKRAEAMREKSQIEIKVVGIANSKQMFFERQGIPLGNWETILNHSMEEMNRLDFIDRMTYFGLPNTIFVDCTTSQEVADCYQGILQSHISVVTPNKKANSGAFEAYETLQKIASENTARFLYDANVGAGLPILSAVKSLVRGGDRIVKVEAVLSGTCSYLFNSFTSDRVFSEIVYEAQEKGFTEPDPRDDLNGLDFARKMVIVAREAGYPLELSDVSIESFLPERCFQASSVEDFYFRLKQSDEDLAELRRNAESEGKVLRYIATLENGAAAIRLQAVGPEHPFYRLSGCNNAIAITSELYADSPLVIQGPGAGLEITAGRVFSGIVQAAND